MASLLRIGSVMLLMSGRLFFLALVIALVLAADSTLRVYKDPVRTKPSPYAAFGRNKLLNKYEITVQCGITCALTNKIS